MMGALAIVKAYCLDLTNKTVPTVYEKKIADCSSFIERSLLAFFIPLILSVTLIDHVAPSINCGCKSSVLYRNTKSDD